MEKLICDYLRILDIDTYGYFIRLINISLNHSLDLSNINIRQFNINNKILNSYTFNDQIKSLLPNREIVTIYAKDYKQLKFDIKPYIFISKDIIQWLTNDNIQTEISINKIVFSNYKNCSYITNDIPLLFINRSIDTKQISRKTKLYLNQYTRFIFPYCLPPNNITNPHTSALFNQNERKY